MPSQLFQRSTGNFVPYTPTVTSGATDSNYPIGNITNREYPFLPWRSTNLLPQEIVLDLGSAVNVSHVAVFHANFRTLALSHAGTLGGSYTGLGGMTLAPYIAEPLPLTRAVLPVTFTNPFLKLAIAPQSTTTSTVAYSIGMIEVLSAGQMITFFENPEQFVNITVDAPTFTQRIGSHTERVKAGPKTVSFELTGDWENLVDVKAILATPPAPFILYRNRGIPAEGFFVRCDGGRYSEGFPLSSGTVTLSEVR